jgi:hypothetical protein
MGRQIGTALRNQIVSDQLLVRTTTVPASRSCNSLLDAMINKIKFREQPAGMIKYVTAWSVNLPAKAAGLVSAGTTSSLISQRRR